MTTQAGLIRAVAEIIKRHGEAGRGNASMEEAARRWIDAGFEEVDEIDEWLAARCYSAEGAQILDRAGITPAQAGMRTRAGTADYEETIGYKITEGDLTIDEARRIITSAFWNS